MYNTVALKRLMYLTKIKRGHINIDDVFKSMHRNAITVEDKMNIVMVEESYKHLVDLITEYVD